MARLQRLALSAAGCMILVAAQQAAAAANYVDGQCVTSYDATVDYFPEKLNTNEDDAQYFKIQYFNNYKLVTDQRNQQTYALVQCGTPTPSNLPNGTEVYQVPVTNAAVLETTVVPYLEMLGVADTVRIIADGSMVTSPCFQKYQQDSANNVTELSATNTTLAASQLDTVPIQFGANPYSLTKLDDNETVTDATVYEPDILGRVSWLGYYAVFYNVEGLANQILANITTNYNNLVKAASGYSDNEKPLVAWTTYNAPDQYNNNTASWTISTANYKAQLTQDAGGRLFNSSTTSWSSAAAFLEAITDVDIMIDETYIATTLEDVMANYQINSSSSFKFIQNKAIYREDGILTQSGGYDWFAAAIVMGDALLEDMVNVVNPSAPSSDYKRHWLRNVAKDEPIAYSTAANCTWDETQPRPNMAQELAADTTFQMSSAVSLTASGTMAAMLLSAVAVLLL